MALTAAKAMQVLNTPQARSMIRQMATRSVQALGRSRARRAANNRYYVGKKVGIPPKRGVPRSPSQRVQAMPAAYNASSVGVSGRIRLAKREKIAWSFDCKQDDNGGVASMRVTPRESIFFPILSDMANTYTRFRFVKLVIEYVPRVGTTNNGNVYFGWQPQPSYEANDTAFPSVEVITAMPRTCTTSIRQGMKFSIPCGGEKFMNPPTGGPSYEPMNYYDGFLIVTAQGPDEEHVGDIWVDYVVDLIEPIRDMTVQTTALNLFTNAVVSKGRFNGTVTNDGEYNWWTVYSPRPLTMVLRCSCAAGTADTPTLYDAEGNTIAYKYNSTADTRRFLTYELGAGPSGVSFRIVHGANNTYSSAVVFQTVTSW